MLLSVAQTVVTNFFLDRSTKTGFFRHNVQFLWYNSWGKKITINFWGDYF